MLTIKFSPALKKVILPIFIGFLLSTSVFIKSAEASPTQVIYRNGHITGVEVWTSDNIYVIDNHLTVDTGATLIIQPGTIIKIAGNKVIGVYGKLKIGDIPFNQVFIPIIFKGTGNVSQYTSTINTTEIGQMPKLEVEQIIITSLKDDTVGGDTNGDGSATAPAPGDWGHIAFFDSSVDSQNVIEYATIRYGGYYANTNNQYYNCYYCEYWGLLRFDSASPTIHDNTFDQNRGYTLSASIDSFPVIHDNTMTTNEGNGLEIRGGTLSATTPTTYHWSNTDVAYAITSHTTIASGVTLVIDPGVVVKFEANKLLGVNGVLKVQGTVADPVTITSLKDDTVGGDTNGDGSATAPAPGDWGHIAFFNSSVDSQNVIEYATIRYGGYYANTNNQYYNCYYCEYWGLLRFDSASPTIHDNTFDQNRGYTLSASIDSFPVIHDNTMTTNEGNGLEIRGGTLSATTPTTYHWSNTDVAYAITSHTTIASGVTLVIDPGVVVKFEANKLLGVNGVLKVLGTVADPVTITSLKDDTVGGDTNGDGSATAPAPGDWGHIAFFDSSVDSQNVIEYATIRYGGYYANTNNQYYNCYYCEYWGLLRFDSASPTIHDNTFDQNRGYTLSASIDSFPVIHDNTMTTNEGNGLEIRGGTLSATTPTTYHWSNTDVAYAITSHTTIASGVTLVIDPGVVVKFEANKLLGVNGVLKVLGTVADPVTITSLKDDTVGGDTNGDGSATAPAPGDWGHIAFFNSSVDSQNVIEYATIRYGGYYANTNNQYYNCYYCEYWGLLRFDSASPTIHDNTFDQNRGYTLSASIDSFPVIHDNTMTTNEGNGLEIRGGTLSATTPTTYHWSNTDVAYAITSHTTIASGVTLVIDPGVVVKFEANKLLGVNGVLKVLGTVADPVTITSLKDDTVGGDTNGDGSATAPAPGDWGHISFLDSSVDAENLIEYATIRYGGYYANTNNQYYNCYYCEYWGAVRFHSASPTIQFNEITLNNNGLRTATNSLPTIENNSIHDNQNYGFYNEDTSVVVDATNNWWGDASGPYNATQNPGGTGNPVSDYVNFTPWLTSPPYLPE